MIREIFTPQKLLALGMGAGDKALHLAVQLLLCVVLSGHSF